MNGLMSHQKWQLPCQIGSSRQATAVFSSKMVKWPRRLHARWYCSSEGQSPSVSWRLHPSLAGRCRYNTALLLVYASYSSLTMADGSRNCFNVPDISTPPGHGNLRNIQHWPVVYDCDPKLSCDSSPVCQLLCVLLLHRGANGVSGHLIVVNPRLAGTRPRPAYSVPLSTVK